MAARPVIDVLEYPRMREPRQHAGLPREALRLRRIPERREQQLERDARARVAVASSIHDAHAAAANLLLDLEAAPDDYARSELHGLGQQRADLAGDAAQPVRVGAAVARDHDHGLV